jgi:hypothetical protein
VGCRQLTGPAPDGLVDVPDLSRVELGQRSLSAVRTGVATTGPTPAVMSRSTPAALSGTMMSEKRIAASTPCRRTGWRVISVTRSGRVQASSMPIPARTARYSGSDRPAWRMNQTGVRSTGSRRIARTSRDVVTDGRSSRLILPRSGARTPADPTGT